MRSTRGPARHRYGSAPRRAGVLLVGLACGLLASPASAATVLPVLAAVPPARSGTPAPSRTQLQEVLTGLGLPATQEPTAAQRRAVQAIWAAFPPQERGAAVRVAWCESRLDPEAVGHNADGTADWGLFQFNDGGTLQHYLGTPDAALDPVRSARAARAYVELDGWRPWTCGRLAGVV